jgi:DNA-binding CsgD family transcriptional regulator
MALIKSADAIRADLERLPDDRRSWPRGTRGRAGLLSDRQAECLRRVQAGQRRKRIAAELGIQPDTVHSHVKRAADKLGINIGAYTRGGVLTDQQRLFLTYREAGLTYGQIAARTRTQTGSVGTQLTRARTRLRCATVAETIAKARELGLLLDSTTPKREVA